MLEGKTAGKSWEKLWVDGRGMQLSETVA